MIRDLKQQLFLSKHGQWQFRGEPVQNEKVATLFHHSVTFDESCNDFVIAIKHERATFSYHITPLMVMSFTNEEMPYAVLNNRTSISLESAKLSWIENQFIFWNYQTTAWILNPAHQQLIAGAVDESHISLSASCTLSVIAYEAR